MNILKLNLNRAVSLLARLKHDNSHEPEYFAMGNPAHKALFEDSSKISVDYAIKFDENATKAQNDGLNLDFNPNHNYIRDIRA